MTFRVRTLSKAQLDIAAIVRWFVYNRQSPAAAAAWLDAYDEAWRGLQDFPARHGVAAEDDAIASYTIRQFLFKTPHGRLYRGLFIIDGQDVLILRVRAPRQGLVDSSQLT